MTGIYFDFSMAVSRNPFPFAHGGLVTREQVLDGLSQVHDDEIPSIDSIFVKLVLK
jgi:hypothetical protein